MYILQACYLHNYIQLISCETCYYLYVYLHPTFCKYVTNYLHNHLQEISCEPATNYIRICIPPSGSMLLFT